MGNSILLTADGNVTLYTHSCSGRYVLAQHLQVDSLLNLINWTYAYMQNHRLVFN
ncbi:hypothetical protein YC2023_011207 [Brassica napus]